YQLRCVGWDSVQISTVISIIDSDIAVLNPSEPLKCLAKRSDARLYYRRALGEWMHKHDAPHSLRLLRARRQRPRCRRAAERCQEFSSSDVACHVTLRLGVILMQWRNDTTFPSRGLGLIAGQSKYGVNDDISRVCNEPPDNVDIDSCLLTQRR